MNIVKLKNGSEEPEPLVQVTFMSLRSLMEKNPIALYELVMKCRDSNHRLFGNSGEILRSYSLLESDDQPHSSTRNIVLSAVVGDGLEMRLQYPIEKEAA